MKLIIFSWKWNVLLEMANEQLKTAGAETTAGLFF